MCVNKGDFSLKFQSFSNPQSTLSTVCSSDNQSATPFEGLGLTCTGMKLLMVSLVAPRAHPPHLLSRLMDFLPFL